MSIQRENESEDIEIVPASLEEKSIVANLLELYAYDFSEFIDLKLGIDGRFGYKNLPLYWEERNRYPFIVRVGGQLAGLVLMGQGSEISESNDTWDMAEFFVLRGYRRRGIGMKVAQEIWKRYSGKWEIRVMEKNEKGKKFWQEAVEKFIRKTAEPITVEKRGKRWVVYTFES